MRRVRGGGCMLDPPRPGFAPAVRAAVRFPSIAAILPCRTASLHLPRICLRRLAVLALVAYFVGG